MKTYAFLALVAIVGVAAGFSAAAWRVCSHGWDPDLVPGLAGLSGPSDGAELASTFPKIRLDSESYDFGVGEAYVTMHHDFMVTNEGGTPLTLDAGRSTCKCTIAKLPEEGVAPDETIAIRLEWTGKSYGEFQQQAVIHTNDPLRESVTLAIKGRLTAAAALSEPELDFGNSLEIGETRITEIMLYGYQDTPVEVTSVKTSDPEHFQVVVAPLSDERIAKEADAKSGRLLQVTVKSGLPLGPFHATISLETNLEKIPAMEIPVSGVINSDVEIVGPGWSSEHRVLDMGRLRQGQEFVRTLFIRVGGAYHKEVKFEQLDVVPDFLQVELGETNPLNNGRVSVTPLTVRIPGTSPPCNFFGPRRDILGRITIHTTHPELPELVFYVRFLIEG